MSISNPTHRHTNNENEGGVVYATFVSEYDFLSHSVICAFDIDDIDRLFANSPYYTKDKNRNVYLRKRRDEASRKIGQCHNHSDQLTEDEAIMLRSHPLMVDSIPSVFGRAVGVYQGDDHYNQIAVLEKAGQLEMLGSPQWVKVKDGAITNQFNLPRQGVSLIKLTW